MTNEKVINQLESLREHCLEEMDSNDDENIWAKDVIALTIAINKLKGECK